MANEASSGGLLRSLIERAEDLQRERDKIDEDMKSLLAEVKAEGFDTKVFKKALEVRKQDKTAVAERGALLQTYLDAAEGDQ